jgi:hypothetical protein
VSRVRLFLFCFKSAVALHLLRFLANPVPWHHPYGVAARCADAAAPVLLSSAGGPLRLSTRMGTWE